MPFFITTFPLMAEAYSFGDDSGFSLIIALNNLIELISSKIGGAVCVLSIVCVGYEWLYAGRLEKRPAVVAIVSISIIFSSSWIANYLGFISS